ncbi:hypothetical protein SY85_15565 [Flavisolibacter tropicus]|uniref:Uncharacterized protein n=1 Tax=Flavisolibacter tropicus TaxID=1492898 RepID=A0A172TXK9_9BACT|nr:hypothetical protein SY85_15565 [Flavisolibacter tropicus]
MRGPAQRAERSGGPAGAGLIFWLNFFHQGKKLKSQIKMEHTKRKASHPAKFYLRYKQKNHFVLETLF